MVLDFVTTQPEYPRLESLCASVGQRCHDARENVLRSVARVIAELPGDEFEGAVVLAGRLLDPVGLCVYDVAEEVGYVWDEQRMRFAQTAHLRAIPYRDYLLTEHWQSLRADMLQAAGRRCQLCYGQGVLHVHHRTYERRGCELHSDLIVLCEHCHAKHHDKLPGGGG